MADNALPTKLPTGLQFTLIAPERVLAQRSAVMVTLPGSEGMLGILPGHAPLITRLSPGIVTVEGDDDAKAGTANTVEQIFVGGGFAEVALNADGSELTVLADLAMPLDELSATELQAARERLLAELPQAHSESDAAMLQAELSLVEAKLIALETRRAA